MAWLCWLRRLAQICGHNVRLAESELRFAPAPTVRFRKLQYAGAFGLPLNEQALIQRLKRRLRGGWMVRKDVAGVAAFLWSMEMCNRGVSD